MATEKSPINDGFDGKIIYTWWIVHCHVRLPESISQQNSQFWTSFVGICWIPDLFPPGKQPHRQFGAEPFAAGQVRRS